MQITQRLWVVSELYYPELTSTGYFITNLAEALARDYTSRVVCGQPSYSARGQRAPWREMRNGVDILRCRATTFDKNKLPGRAMNLASASVSLFLRVILNIRRGDTVIAVTNPPVLPYLVVLACKLRGARFVLRVDDVYPEVLTRVGMLRPGTLAVRMMDRASRWLYRHSDRILVLGRDMKRLIKKKLPEDDPRVVLTASWGDTESIYPEPRTENSFLEKLNLSDKFVVQYCGNIGRTHGIEDIVEGAKRLLTEHDIHFLVVGWGAKKDWVLEQKELHGLENLSVLPPFLAEEFRDGLNACDLALISFAPGMGGVSVPSRMYNVLASGKPILASCDDDSELAEVVREEEIGWTVRPGDVDSFVKAIHCAKADSAGLRIRGERARSAAVSKYTMEHTVEQYRNALRNL